MKGSYKELKVWQKAHINSIAIYNLTKGFPNEEKFGITSQIRRAVLSVELNIVEGKYRNTTKEFVHFLYIARASNQETHCLIEIAKDLGIIDLKHGEEIHSQLDEVNKMINGLIKSIS